MKLNSYCWQLLIFIIWVSPLDTLGQNPTPELQKTIGIIKNRSKYPDYVLVCAHRGYWRSFPENTRGAYDMAMQMGADIVELDVRLTKDSVMVVFHDGALDRVTSGYGLLKEENWEDVKKLKLYDHTGKLTDYAMLSLEEALVHLKDKAVIAIDIKEKGSAFERTMEMALRMAKDKGVLYQSIVKGKMTEKQMSDLLARVGITFKDFIYTPITFANVPDLDNYLNTWSKNPDIHAIQLGYKQSKDPLIPYVEKFRALGKWVGIYSFWPQTGDGVLSEKVPLTDTDLVIRDYDFKDRDPDDKYDDGRGNWDWVFAFGADYLITDRTDTLLDYLEAKGKRKK